MKKKLPLLLIALLLALSNIHTAQAQTPAAPVVRAVMFWMAGCKHCEETISITLPPLHEKYGPQFDLTLIQIYDLQEIDALYALAASYGIEQKYVGVPFLVIADQPLVGSQQIRLQLPDLIDENLASGGVELSDRPEILPLLALTARPASSQPVSPSEKPVEPQSPRSNGFTLAAIVLAGTILALLYALLKLIRGRFTARSRLASWFIPFLSLVGLAIALYLAYIEMTLSQAFCGPIGDCNIVQASPYASLFGILPIGLLGVFGYFVILAAWWLGRQPWKLLARQMPLALFGLALFGTLFSAYLTYLELFVIDAVCLWCLGSAVIQTSLLLLITREL